jgi:hypothetical protein
MMNEYITVTHYGNDLYLMVSHIQFFYIAMDEGKERCMVYLAGKDEPLILEENIHAFKCKLGDL